MDLHQRVHLEGAGIAVRLMLPDVVIEVVGVVRAEQAAARPGRQSPYDLVVGITFGPRPTHFYQRIAVDKQRLLALLGPPSFLPHDTHMKGMSVYVQRQGAFPGSVPKQFIADKPLNDLDFIVIGTLPRHTAFLPVIPQRPKRDTSCTGSAEVLSKISVEVRIQPIKRDARLPASRSGKVSLCIYPTRLTV